MDIMNTDYAIERPALYEDSFPRYDSRGLTIGAAPAPEQNPIFPGEQYSVFALDNIGDIDDLINVSPEFAYGTGPQTVWRERTPGIDAHQVDPWAIHPGDVNLQVGYGVDGTARVNDQLVANGPVTGELYQYSGYVAMLRYPTGGQGGPVTGTIGADYAEQVAMSNAETQSAFQLTDAMVNGSVFGAL